MRNIRLNKTNSIRGQVSSRAQSINVMESSVGVHDIAPLLSCENQVDTAWLFAGLGGSGTSHFC